MGISREQKLDSLRAGSFASCKVAALGMSQQDQTIKH